MALSKVTGIVEIPSHHSADRTVQRLREILKEKGVQLFVVVDHSGEAQRAGLKMSPTKLVIFGSPKAGTPLMLVAPSIAIDLPLKILIREDNHGKVWVSYNSLSYLTERHDLPEDLLQNIAIIETLASKIAELARRQKVFVPRQAQLHAHLALRVSDNGSFRQPSSLLSRQPCS